MKKFIERWKAAKKKKAEQPQAIRNFDEDEEWLGGEAMVTHEILEEKTKQKRKKKIKCKNLPRWRNW
jgi:hypothetical protein